MKVQGTMIKRVRATFVPAGNILRIALDMDPARNYNANPILYRSDNTYAVEVSEASAVRLPGRLRCPRKQNRPRHRRLQPTEKNSEGKGDNSRKGRPAGLPFLLGRTPGADISSMPRSPRRAS